MSTWKMLTIISQQRKAKYTTVRRHCPPVGLPKSKPNHPTNWPNRTGSYKLLAYKLPGHTYGATRNLVFLVGVPNGTVTLENTLAVFYEIKYSLTIWPSNPTPRYWPNTKEHVSPHKAVSIHEHSSFPLHSQCIEWKVRSVVNGKANCGAPTQGNAQQREGMNYWHTQRGRTAEASC